MFNEELNKEEIIVKVSLITIKSFYHESNKVNK